MEGEPLSQAGVAGELLSPREQRRRQVQADDAAFGAYRPGQSYRRQPYAAAGVKAAAPGREAKRRDRVPYNSFAQRVGHL